MLGKKCGWKYCVGHSSHTYCNLRLSFALAMWTWTLQHIAQEVATGAWTSQHLSLEVASGAQEIKKLLQEVTSVIWTVSYVVLEVASGASTMQPLPLEVASGAWKFQHLPLKASSEALCTATHGHGGIFGVQVHTHWVLKNTIRGNTRARTEPRKSRQGHQHYNH